MKEELQEKYMQLWNNMVIDSSAISELKEIRDKILLNKKRYEIVSEDIKCPWYIIAVIHYMECSLSFSKHLFNGDSLLDYTKRFPPGFPKGCGKPPFTWECSASESLRRMKMDKVESWTLPIMLRKLEEYNGLGYFKNNRNTPYLWSKTNHYVSGKYKEVKQPDGSYKSIYDPNLKSKQIGAAPLIRYLTDKTLF